MWLGAEAERLPNGCGLQSPATPQPFLSPRPSNAFEMNLHVCIVLVGVCFLQPDRSWLILCTILRTWTQISKLSDGKCDSWKRRGEEHNHRAPPAPLSFWYFVPTDGRAKPHPRQTLKAGGLRGPPPVLSWGLRLTGGGGASALLCLETDALAFLPLQPMSQKHLIHSFTHQRKWF